MNFLKIELFKTIRRKEYKFALIIMTVIPLIFGLLLLKENSFLIVSGKRELGAYQFAVFIFSFMKVSFFLYLMVILMASNVFSKEISDGTINLLIVRSPSRSKVFISKVVSQFIIVNSFILIIILASLLSYFIFVKRGPFSSTEIFSTHIYEDVYFLLISLLDLFVVSCIAVFMSIYFGNIKVILFSLSSVILLKVVERFPYFDTFLPTSIGDGAKIYDITSNKHLYSFKSMGLLLIYSLLLIILAIFIFNRKDIRN